MEFSRNSVDSLVGHSLVGPVHSPVGYPGQSAGCIGAQPFDASPAAPRQSRSAGRPLGFQSGPLVARPAWNPGSVFMFFVVVMFG